MGEPAEKLDTAELWLVDTVKGRSFALRDGFSVGRAGGDVQILDPAVSSKHCVFHLSGRVLEIEDLGSRNGTLVGGKKIEPNKRLALLPGVRIDVGSQSFVVKAGEEPKPRATAVELASLCSQLEPDGIPAPLPGAWSSAALPKTAAAAAAAARSKAPLAPAEPVPLHRDVPAYKASGSRSVPMPRARGTSATTTALLSAERGKKKRRLIAVSVVIVTLLAALAVFVARRSASTSTPLDTAAKLQDGPKKGSPAGAAEPARQ